MLTGVETHKLHQIACIMIKWLFNSLQHFVVILQPGEEYVINESVKVIPTPGHTLSDVTVIVVNEDGETVAITGDLFERFEDVEKPNIWLEVGSDDPVVQMKNRYKVAEIAQWIIPGHGQKFKVTDRVRESLRRQASDTALIKN